MFLRNLEKLTHLNYATNVGRTAFWRAAVSLIHSQIAPSLLNLYLQYYSAGIPQIYHFGQEGLHNILVIDLLGPSLEDLFDMCGRKFSIKSVCMTARQMVCVTLK